MSQALSGRVLVRLERAELHESNPHFQDDYRIAWLTVLYASRGMADPHMQATAKLLGVHPEKVWEKMNAQRRAKLGADYDKFFGDASSPKKPVQSERSLDWKKRGRDAA